MKLTLLIVLWIGTSVALFAQAKDSIVPPPPDHYNSYKPLILKVDSEGKKYIRFIVWNQVWARFTQNNPGTAFEDGTKFEENLDIGMRRLRFLAYAQITPKYLILTHWGINNQTFVNGGAPGAGAKKPQLFFHDVWNEYAVVENKFYLGFGLHYWNGISRLSSHSTLTFMTLDAPIFNWPLIELNDQFARQMGIYAKGQLGRLDYRAAINRPFSVNNTVSSRPGSTVSHIPTYNYALTGYFNWMFGDKESNKLPFFMGSYLGAKKVFNIGAGFYHHPQATRTIVGNDTTRNNITLLGIDVFYDIPLNKEKGTAFSLYSVYYNYDFGKGYIRNVGIMNEGNFAQSNQTLFNQRSFNGPGNTQPIIATGSIWYTQVGLALPKNKKGEQFMPYFTTTFKNFDFLDASWQFDLGINYLITGHNSKITLQYSQRPVYGLDGRRGGERGEFILQTHIFL
jgi:hypothetical protein